MKVIVAMDSFKGSLTSLEAGEAVKKGILRAVPDGEVVVCPLADGGEGTVEVLTAGMRGRKERVTVTGPLGAPVECVYGIVPGSRTAIIEIAGAAGITLVPEQERNPLHTTTYGVGEVIEDAIAKGCRRFLVGLGGSSTNDGGAGMLQALGFRLLNRRGEQIPPGAEGLKELVKIETENILPELKECTFRVACDVKNPLCGKNGCSAVFGPQKGAAPFMAAEMDRWLEAYARLAAAACPGTDPSYPGTGAAGGLGFAFMAFLNAGLEPGIRIVLEETGLEEYVREADFVVTGEGSLDGQTAMGKAPVGVADIAKRYDRKVLAFAGHVTEEAAACNEAGIDAFFPILRSVVTLNEAMRKETAERNLILSVEQVFRLIRICKK